MNNVYLLDSNRKGPSFLLYREMLGLMGIPTVSIDSLSKVGKDDSIIYMGYDCNTRLDLERKSIAKRYICLDPRKTFKHQPPRTDWVIANGLENEISYRSPERKVTCISIYQLVSEEYKNRGADEAGDTGKIVFGYHGNHIHIQSLSKLIRGAIQDVGIREGASFHLCVNAKGMRTASRLAKETETVKVIEWSEENCKRVIAESHVGLCHGTILESGYAAAIFRSIEGVSRRCHASDYKVRYKSCANPGRIVSFQQLGKPTLADLYASAITEIGATDGGLLYHNNESFIYCLKRMIENGEERRRQGANARANFRRKHSIEVMRRRLEAWIDA